MVLYGAEILWNGQKDWCKEYQKIINKQGRTVTEILQSASTGIVTRETRLQPTLDLLNNKHQRYEYRLLAVPVTLPTCDIHSVTPREDNE